MTYQNIFPISLNNQLTSLLTQTNSKKNNHEFNQYINWLDKQIFPDKSYLKHPIETKEQLDNYKKQFKKQFGISLGEYIRVKRIYYLLNNNKMDTVEPNTALTFSYINTPIGIMLAVFSINGLCLLEFLNRKMLETELIAISKQYSIYFIFDTNQKHQQLQQQLDEYFYHNRTEFNIKLDYIGTEFQKKVWLFLEKIPYGQTLSYSQQAEELGQPTAVRAIASANGRNKISIIVPCHRVLQKNGGLGGYGGGIERKKYLLALEQRQI